MEYTTVAHTPTPWVQDGSHIFSYNEDRVVECNTSRSDHDAGLIVRAVNNYDLTVRALKRAEAAIQMARTHSQELLEMLASDHAVIEDALDRATR